MTREWLFALTNRGIKAHLIERAGAGHWNKDGGIAAFSVQKSRILCYYELLTPVERAWSAETMDSIKSISNKNPFKLISNPASSFVQQTVLELISPNDITCKMASWKTTSVTMVMSGVNFPAICFQGFMCRWKVLNNSRHKTLTNYLSFYEEFQVYT